MKFINRLFFRFITLLLICSANKLNAATFTITANTNWSAIPGGPPTSSDIVIVKNGAVLTVNVATAVCASLQLGNNITAPTGNGSIAFNAASQLTVSGQVSLGSAARTGTITMTAGGRLICNSLVQTGNANTAILTPGTGTIELTTTNTLPNSTSFVTFNNLTVNGGTTSLSTGTTLNGNLVITTGAFTIGNVNLTVAGTTTNAGTINISSAVGSNTFTGKITNNGTWNNSANAAVILRGGITNNGSWTSGTGTYTFNTNSQAIDGTTALSFGGSIAITGTINITNQNTVSVTGNITGSVAGSTWINAANSTLNIGGALLATGTLTATANPNTVNYNGGSAQTIKSATYYNLSVSNTGGATSTFAGNTVVNNDFTVISGTASLGGNTFSVTGTTSVTGVFDITATMGTKSFGNIIINFGGAWSSSANETYAISGNLTMSGGSITGTSTGVYNIGGNLIITAGTTNTIGAGTISVTGTSGINGTLNFSSTAGTKTFTGDIIIGSGGVWNSTVTETYAIDGNLIMSGGSITGSATGVYNIAGNLIVTVSTSNTIGVGSFVVTGTTIIGVGASINFSSNTGNKRFIGLLTNNGTFSSTSNEDFNIRGGITNNGTWNGGSGIYSFTTNSQVINGSSPLLFGGTVSITGNRTITNQNTVTIAGDLTGSANGSTWLNAANSTLNIGGVLLATGTLTATANPNTVNYNGATAQSIVATTYHNLSITKTGGSTGTFAGAVTVNNNLTVTSGIGSVGAFALTVTGTSSITGTLNITSATGAKTFNNITVNVGGVWNASAVIPFTVNGSIQNDGTFTANTGVYTLAGATKIISGTSNLGIPNTTITGSYTNNATSFTVSTALIGAGSLTQGVNSTLNLGGTNTVTTFTATAVPNLVNYNGGGAQSIRAATYYNLAITKTGGSTGTFAGITVANNDLTVTSGIGSVGAFALTVGGTTSITGTLNITSATGAKTFNNVTVNTGGVWNASAVIPFAVSGNLQNNGTFTANTGVYTFSGASKTISGTSGLAIPNTTVTGSYTNNTTFTVSTVLTGGGSLTQGANSTLYLGGTNTVTTFSASAVPNLVDYNGGGAQSIKNATYYNLSVTKSGGSTGIFAGNTTVNNNFTVTSGVANIPGFDLTVSGNTSITGTFSISSTTGTKSFSNVTVNSGGVWNATASEDISINGNIQNDGTITSNTGVYTFSGASKTFSGTNPVTISKITITGSYTNNGTINCSTALSGAGSLIQGLNSNLFIGGTDALTTLNAATNANTVTFNGGTAQTISLSRTFYNLTVSNASGVSLTADQNLMEALTLSSGNLTTTGRQLTFLSSSTRTARLAPVVGASTITGNIVMQRFAPGGKTGWATMSAPITSSLASWTDDFPTSGFPGASGTASGFVSIYTYDETAAGTADNGYVAATSSANGIIPGKGYFVYLGTAYTNTADINIEVPGPTVIGNKPLPVTYTSSGGASEDGWNLVANPYPSAIDWEAAAWTRSNINSTFYVYNADIGNYATYTLGGAATNGGTRYIPSSQGFFVQAAAAAPVLTATENVKVSNNPSFFRTASSNSVNPTLISFKLTSDSTTYYDETVIRFMPMATNQFDGQFDAYKLFTSEPTAPSLSTVMGGIDYTVNSFPEIGYEQVIPLRTKAGISSPSKLSWTGVHNFPKGTCLMLEDTYTHTFTDFTTDSVVNFYLSDTTSSPRFLIHVSQPYRAGVIADACNNSASGAVVIETNSQQNFSYTIADSIGAVISSAANILSDTVLNLYPGNYVVNYTSNNAMCPAAEINIVISEQANVIADFVPGTDTLYLNSNSIIPFTNLSTGTSVFMWNFGDGNQSADKDPLHEYTQTGTYQVSLIAGSGNCSDTIVKTILVIDQSILGNKSLIASGLTIMNTPSDVWIDFYENRNTNASIKIFNATGAVIAAMEQPAGKGTISLNKYFPATGIYYVQVVIDNKVFARKICVNK